MALFEELKRRNVLRVAALYLVSAWLVAQVADVVIGLGELPPAVGHVVLIILAAGFPVTVIVAWFFEWTSAGIRRETTGAELREAMQSSRRRLDYVIFSLLLVALGYFAATHDWSGPPQVSGASIAVLPFENRSAQPDDLYFTDGIHEDILTQLAKIGSLVVISRTSVMRYRDSVKPIPEIAAELGVAAVLEGGVQRAGNRVRINLQLIDTATDRHLWAETFDRELSADNVFAIQSEIAATIARTLQAQLLPRERQAIQSVPTHNLEAYDAYLLGRRSLATRWLDEMQKARAYFESAIRLDPDFALAYTGLADTLILISNWGEVDPGALLEQAENAARRALELDPDLGEAYTSLGIARQYRGAPAAEFVPYLERGVQLAPGSADARKWYASYLSESGRDAESLEQLFVAVRLDPMSPIIRVNLASGLRDAGRREEALEQLQRTLKIDPQFQPALFELSDFGVIDDVLAGLSRIHRAQQPATNPWMVLEIVLSYLTLGDDQRAAAWAAELERVAADSRAADIARLNLALFSSQEAAAIRWANALYPNEGGITVPSRALLMFDLRRGEPETALARYRGRYPELLSDDPEVTELYPVAIDVALLYRALGETERAERLLDRSLAFIHQRPAGEVDEFGVFLARIHALRGERDAALNALRRAVDAGWRRGWWFYLEQDLAFDSLRDEARYQAIVQAIRADMARQLAHVRELEASGQVALPPESHP